MELGTSILMSALIVCATALYFATRRRLSRNWKKIVFGSAGLSILAVVAFHAGYWGWENFRARPRAMTELGGIGLGMSMSEVAFLKGAPTSRKAFGPGAAERWVYEEQWSTGAKIYIVDFLGESGRVFQVVYTGHAYEALNGVGLGHTAGSMTEKLGEPTDTDESVDHLERLACYKRLKTCYGLEKGLVVDLIVYEPSAFTPGLSRSSQPRGESRKTT